MNKMSEVINLPKKSDINRDKEKESEVITLNIYNNNTNFTETMDNINQTEENLYIKDNYNNLIKPNNNNIIYYDNVREKSNNYPLSENRVIQSPNQFDNNKYYKSFNPYVNNNNNYQINNNKIYEPNMNNINTMGAKPPIIYHPKKEETKQPKKNKENMCIICCIGYCLFMIFPPLGLLYCFFKFRNNNNNN